MSTILQNWNATVDLIKNLLNHDFIKIELIINLTIQMDRVVFSVLWNRRFGFES